jgi:hypothetical protein
MTTSGVETAALRLVISGVNKLNLENINNVFSNPNHLVVNLLRLPDNRRLRRFLPTDQPDRF